MLLHAQLAVGLVQVAILVEVELVEALGQARIGLGFLTADAAILVRVQLGPALAAATTVAAVLPARQLITRELAVLVLVQLIELRGQTRVGRRFAAVDEAIAIGIQLGRTRCGAAGVSAAKAIPVAEVPSSRASSRGVRIMGSLLGMGFGIGVNTSPSEDNNA